MNSAKAITRILLFLLSFIFQELKAQQQSLFPLTLCANRRFLVDMHSNAFLIREISAWGLIQSLSEQDESAFLDSILKKGFNTM